VGAYLTDRAEAAANVFCSRTADLSDSEVRSMYLLGTFSLVIGRSTCQR
jgi:hypothetical protein